MKNTILSVAAILLTAGSASAENVLVWGTGDAGFGGENNVSDYLVASGAFSSVTNIQSDTTLDFATLNSYDRVLYYSNTSAGQNPDAIGDVLHQFAQTGKRLVIATFAWAAQGSNTLGGDIIDQGTSPFTLAGSTLYNFQSMQANDGSEFFAGVNTLTGFYRDNVALTNGATLHGTWSDGTPLLASKGNVVGVNLFPNDFFGNISGDYKQLFVNSLIAVPAPGLGAFAAVGVLALARRRR